jgi:hypothetical protein
MVCLLSVLEFFVTIKSLLKSRNNISLASPRSENTIFFCFIRVIRESLIQLGRKLKFFYHRLGFRTACLGH